MLKLRRLNNKGFSHDFLAILFVVIFAIVGVGYLVASHADTTVVATVQAEQMTIPKSASIVSDTTASAGKAVIMNRYASLTGNVSLPVTANAVSISAKATQCNNRWPKLRVNVDQQTVIPYTAVNSTSYHTYMSANLSLTPGAHTITVTADNLGYSNCARPLSVDVTSFYGQTTSAPTVSLSATPTTISAGQSSTLNWNSTNATSCTASGGWSGSEPTSGSHSTGALSASTTYSLSCTGSGGTANGSTTVTVAGGGGGGGTGKDEGKPLYRLDAASNFDAYASNTTWIKAHVNRITAYPSFGDRYVQTGIPVEGYHDPYTDKVDLSTSWQTVVNELNRDMGVGYAGIFVDDSNFAGGNIPGTQADLANLFVQLRKAQPNAFIEMNAQYHDIWPLMQANNQYVEQALAQVNIVTKEFGVGPTAGINSASDYASFMKYVDTLHSKRIHTVLTGDHNSPGIPTMEYNEATYFLINDGSDYINGNGQNPTNFWPGFTVNLGDATSARQRSASGVWSRSFAHGIVYTVEPGASTQTITPPAGAKDVNGNPVSSVTISPANGVVLTLP